MKIHEVKRKTRLIKRPRIGRGGRRGKTSGKGHKGQKARAGKKIRPEIRDIIKKIPKLRGRGINSNKPIDAAFAAVKLPDIDAVFNAGDRITPKNLYEKDLIRKVKGKLPKVKIVGPAELKKKLTFAGVKMTIVAKKAIEAVGGQIK